MSNKFKIKVLLLHDNSIKDLKSGGDLKNLAQLRVSLVLFKWEIKCNTCVSHVMQSKNKISALLSQLNCSD